MKRESQNHRVELLAVFCALLTFSIFGGSGCTNHGTALNTVKAAVNASSNLPLPPSSTSPDTPGVAGSWACADSQCQSDTIKTISPKLDTIVTDFTEHLPASSPQSICRFREVSRLSIDKALVQGPFSNTVTGQVTRQPIQLVNSPENTHDCGDLAAKISLDSASGTETLSFEEDQPTELTINGIHYHRLADEKAQAIVAYRSELGTQGISGDWDCIEDGSDGLKQTIAGDRKSITTESIMEFSDGEKCRIREIATLSISDDTDPMKLYATRTRGAFSLVSSAENTSKCGEIITYINQEKTKEGPSVVQFTIERDGSEELLIQGKRFVRRRISL